MYLYGLLLLLDVFLFFCAATIKKLVGASFPLHLLFACRLVVCDLAYGVNFFVASLACSISAVL